MKITNTRIDKIDFNEMEDFIEMIKSYDFSESYFSYPFIKNAIREIKVPVPKYVIPKGTILYRGRVHKNGEQFFHRVSDISYIRDCFLIKNFGRANEPCQSIFYCSDNQKTAFNETCTITREDIDKDSELITWGAWEVNGPNPCRSPGPRPCRGRPRRPGPAPGRRTRRPPGSCAARPARRRGVRRGRSAVAGEGGR